MPESATHAGLVQAVIEFAEYELGAIAEIAVRDDAVRSLRGERPPRIEGFTPDVHAVDVPTTRTLIGEAKTRADLETDHSRRQISAFLGYLAKTSGGLFVLAVPLTAGATARRLLRQLNAPFTAKPTRLIVLDGSVLRLRDRRC
jgi:hypothetical protein